MEWAEVVDLEQSVELDAHEQVVQVELELQVQLMEQEKQMQAAVQSGEMLPERYNLEMEKAQKMMADQIASYQQECMSKLQAEASKIENQIITEKEYKILYNECKY